MAKILIVEQDPFIGDVLSTTLERAGHEVLLTADCVDGWSSIQQHRVDLLIVDMALACAWRPVPEIQHTMPPTIALVMGSQWQPEQHRAQGFVDVIHKPFGIENVVTKIEALMRERAVGL